MTCHGGKGSQSRRIARRLTRHPRRIARRVGAVKASGSIFTLNLRHPRVLLWSFQAEERGVFYWSTKASLARCEVPNMDQTACRSQEFCGRSTAAAQLLPWPHGARMVPRGAQTAHTRFDVDSHGNWRRLTVPQVRTHTPHAWHGMAWRVPPHPARRGPTPCEATARDAPAHQSPRARTRPLPRPPPAPARNPPSARTRTPCTTARTRMSAGGTARGTRRGAGSWTCPGVWRS